MHIVKEAREIEEFLDRLIGTVVVAPKIQHG